MANQTFADFIYGQKLTQLIQSESIRGGIPNPLPAELFRVTRQVQGNMVEYDQVDGNRTAARIVQYGSPSQRRAVKGAQRKTATMVHSNEHIVHDESFLTCLKQTDNPLAQQAAQQEIVRRTRNFARGFDTLRISAVLSAFATGHIYADASGVILPSSTGAKLDLDFGIPTGNFKSKTQLGDWSQATTDIPGKLKAFRAACAKANGYMPVHVLYGASVPGYLAANNYTGKLIQMNSAYNQSFLQSNAIPQGFMDMQWHPVSDAFLLDATGTPTSLFDDKSVVFLPEIGEDWYEFVEGSKIIPTGVATAGQSLEELIAGVSMGFGQYTYVEMMTDPISIKQIAGDTFLPLIKVPSAVYPSLCA